MSAYYSPGASVKWNLPSAVQQLVSSSNNNYQQTSSNTGNDKKSSKKTEKKSGLDKLKEWLEKLFDWVEVRVERLEYTIDLYQAKSENAVGYIAKNSYLKNAFNTTNTLIGNAQKGAEKYLEQAEKVRKKAVELGVVSNNASKNLVKLIQSGAIQIEEYDEKTREFINSYKEWFDKSLELQAQVEDLRAQRKEIMQQRLDNITDQFEATAGWSDAVSARAESMMNFLTSAGRSIDNRGIKQSLGTQINEQRLMIGRYNKELEVFADAMVDAKAEFGENSIEYRDAQTKYEEINKALIDASTQFNELNQQLYELDLTKLEYAMDKLEAFGDKLSSIVSLKETRGTRYGATSDDIVGEADYYQQVTANNDLIKLMAKDREKRIQEIAKYGWDIDSEKYKEAYDAIMNDEKEILNMLESNEKLKESIRTLRWKPFEELQDQLDQAIDDYDHLRNLISDAEMFDDKDGIYMTERGYAELSLLAQQIGVTQGKIADYRKALDKLQDEYKSGNISLETFNETSRDYIGIIQQSVQAVDGYKDAIVDLYKTQISNENDALQKVISLRKDALSAKKAYYDYDKTLSEKSKDVSRLRAQIMALQNVTNDAAKAQRARLQAQLAEAEQELQDTIRQHQYEATSEGYDKLSQDSQEALDTTIRQLEANADQQDQIVNMMLDKLKTNYSDAYTSIQSIISSTGTVIGDVSNSSINQLRTTADNIIALARAMQQFQVQASATAMSINTTPIVTSDSQTQQIEKEIRQNNTDQKIQDAKANTTPSGVAKTPDVKSADQAVADAEKKRKEEEERKKKEAAEKAAKEAAAKAAAEKAAKEAAEKAAAEKAAKEAAEKAKKTRTTKQKYGVALAIWNGGYGWGTGETRKKRLKQKGFNPTEVQNIVNKMGRDGYVYSGAWVGKYYGIKSLSPYAYNKFKKGTKRVGVDQLAWTNEGWQEDGPELIVSKRDGAILTPLKAGDSVIPANLTDNLFKWGAIDPSMLSDKFVSKLPNVSGMSTNLSAPVTIESLITVNGNVDESVMPQLEELGKQLANNLNFQKDMTKVISHNLYKDAKKQGYRI